MRAIDGAILGLAALMVCASGLAFFLYVPVPVIGAAWLFGAAIFLSTAFGVWIGWSFRRSAGVRVLGRGKNHARASWIPGRPKVVPITSVAGAMSLEQLNGRAAVN